MPEPRTRPNVKVKGSTRGIDKVGSIHGSANVISTTSQPPTAHLCAACLKVPARVGVQAASPSALSIGMALTRRSIEIKTKHWGLCRLRTTQYVHDVMMAMPHAEDGQCRFSVCSLNVSPANHIAACSCRSQAEPRGGGCAGGGREASRRAGEQASDVGKKGRQGAGLLSPMLWDRRRGCTTGVDAKYCALWALRGQRVLQYAQEILRRTYQTRPC